MTQYTRRDVIDSMMATAAAAALSPLAAIAQPVDGESLKAREALLTPAPFQDFRDFIRLSSALTGISGILLAPASATAKDKNGQPIVNGADTAQAVKLAYFNLARADLAYPRLLEEFKAVAGASGATAAILDQAASQVVSSSSAAVAQLARSIIMAWYFGVWYEWDITGDKPRFTLISADAYTQGWAWRIVEAHPAGYSNMRFGHWAFEPPPAFKPDAIVQTGDAV